ncbi:MAG: hypothetical protein AAFU60_14980, partial [Bacteroidota bacterium]
STLFPLEVTTNSNFALSLEAVDENGNLDMDNNASVSLSKASGIGNLTVTSPQNFSGGLLTFNDVQFDADDTHTVGVSATGFSSQLSGNIITRTPNDGDFRSRNTNGNWNTASDWETFSGGSWITATLVPSSSDGRILIQNGHTMTIDLAISIDEVVVAPGAILERGAGHLVTLNDGTEDDLIIQGIYKVLSSGSGDNYADAIAYSGNAKILVESTGTLEINIAGGSQHFTYAIEPITRVEFQDGATFRWNPQTSAAFASTNITYFPGVASDVQPIFQVSNSVVIGSSDPTTINGMLAIDAGVSLTVQNAGLKTFRNGLRGEGTLTQLLSSGNLLINGIGAELSLSRLELNAELQINNGDTTQMNSQVTMEGGLLNLINGKLNLNGNNLRLGDNAQISEDRVGGHVIDDFCATDETNTGGFIEA